MAKKNPLATEGLKRIWGPGLEEVVEELELKEKAGRAEEIALKLIKPNPYQPRKFFSEQSLKELTASIKQQGLIQPIIINKDPEQKDKYFLIAGERRLRASQQANLTTIKALVLDLPLNRVQEIAITENIQRESLTPLEEAQAYFDLKKHNQITDHELAKRVGKNRTYVTNMMRLLHLPSNLKKLLQDKKLTVGHVRPFLALTDKPELIAEMIKTILKEGYNVRQTEAMVREALGGQSKAKAVKPRVNYSSLAKPLYVAIAHQLTRQLDTKVVLSNKALHISFSDEAHLQKLLKQLHLEITRD